MPGRADEPDYGLLPPGATAYLWADVAGARPLLDALPLDALGKDAPQVLARTRAVTAALYPNSAYFLVARGSYPSGGARFSLALNRDWKLARSPTGGRYWRNRDTGVGLAVGPGVALVSSAGQDPFAPGGSAPPPGFDDFRRSCAAAGWIPTPAAPVNGFLESLGVPLQVPAVHFFFGVIRAGEDAWQLQFRAQLPSETQAAAISTLFALARVFVTGGSGVKAAGLARLMPGVFANPLTRDGAALMLTSQPFTASELSLLFSLFSVYSDQSATRGT